MLPTLFRLCSLRVIGSLLLWGFFSAEILAGTETEPAMADDEDSHLLERLDEQQRQIDELEAKVDEANARAEEQEREMRALRDREEEPVRRKALDQVLIGGQGAVAFFHTGSDGQFPNGEFRPDEARLFAEAQVWRNVFVLSELNLVTREEPDEFFTLGELYVDFENVSGLWGSDNLVNLRLGRFYIPFGEEYIVRNPIPNPLISHSLSDIWGVDEGIAAFGRRGKFHYAVAVQNGGHPTLRDFHPDKSIAGRIGYAPFSWLSTSFSAMRTGKISADRDDDFISEIWFGDGFIRSLGDPATTETFQADLFELDVGGRWRSGHLKGAGGVVLYRDDDPTARNEREAYYYYLEGKQAVAGSLYAAARFSHIYASDGFLIVGHGDRGTYFFRSDAPLTKDLWRLSFGLGYEFSSDLIAKVEIAREDGRLLDGTRRRDHDFVGAQLAYRF